MADKSRIEWTDATWNPLRGCSRVSDGCRNCYAETVAARFSGPGMAYEGLIHPSTKGWNGQVRLIPELLRQPWDWVKPRRIFVNSMSDLFHESVPFEYIAAVFFIMAHTTRHTYQVLTKRPQRMLDFLQWLKTYDPENQREEGDELWGYWLGDAISDAADQVPAMKALEWEPSRGKRGGYDNCGPGWPYENIWLGVSVENQMAADERIPLLLQCPAAVRWVSCEPLLGPVDLTCIGDGQLNVLSGRASNDLTCCVDHEIEHCAPDCSGKIQALDWVVVGGESGYDARPMHPAWALSLRDQCAATAVPFFFKQWGEWSPMDEWQPWHRRPQIAIRADGSPVPDEEWYEDGFRFKQIGKRAAGRLLDGVEHNAFPAVRI
jgi:protein gp37